MNKITLIFLSIISLHTFAQEGQFILKMDGVDNTSVVRKFEAKYGSVFIDWNKKTGTPHRVVCHPISLAKSIDDQEQLEDLLRNFIAQNSSFFKLSKDQYQLQSIKHVRDKWYASFRQVFNGIEIENSEIIFRVHDNGNLFLFGFDTYPINEIKQEVRNKKLIENIALSEYQDASVEIEESKLVILPIFEKNHFRYRYAYSCFLRNNHDLAKIVYLDAETGKILKTIEKSHNFDLSGLVESEILPTVPTDDIELRNLKHLHLNINGNEVITDNNGEFEYVTLDTLLNLTAGLNGDFCTVSNTNLPNASISQTITNAEPITLTWNDNNSTLEERNVYYHLTELHDHLKTIDDNFTYLDFPMQCIVNYAGSNGPCNAFWNGTNLHFGIQASNCAMNSAHGTSVIYHEYGHAINDKLYISMGEPWGLKNPILHEAFSDIYACLLLEDSRFALGWFGLGTFTRNLDNTNEYPASIVGQQHSDGLILGGTFWDLGLLTSPETAFNIAHFLKYGMPDDDDIAVAFSEVYFEALVADDDDGDLFNGSLHQTEINLAFCMHGIGAGLFANELVQHQPLENSTEIASEYPVQITLENFPFTEFTLGNMNLVYSTNDFDNTFLIPFESIDDNNYQATIPAQEEGTLVKYYFSLSTGNCAGSEMSHPSSDFLHEYYSFYVGDYITVFEDDFETDQNWEYGNSDDNATAGIWERTNPELVIDDTGFEVQPDDDHSELGANCLVTGGTQGGIWYANDVDGGKTTVTSPVISNLDNSSIVTFYKWFAHGAGFVFPAQGNWKFEVSNNGTSWTTIENTNYGNHKYWIKSQYKVNDYLNITDEMQFRFVVSDFGAGSIVEGLVDDFRIVSLNGFVGIHQEDSNPEISVFPNPARSEFHIQVSGTEKYQLKIMDAQGKLLEYKSIHSKNYTWKRKNLLQNGIYFLEIIFENGEIRHKKIVFQN